MAATATDLTASPFFRLARELRDQIYDDCLGSGHSNQTGGPRCYAKNSAVTRLLLVSRQFGSEYTERAKALSHCSIIDYSALGLESLTAGLEKNTHIVPRALAKIGSFRFDLACYKSFRELTQHGIWVPRYLDKLAGGQSLVIRVAFPTRKFANPKLIVMAINESPLLGLRNLKQLEVYVLPERDEHIVDVAEISGRHKLIAKLSKETGKVEAVED